ncbi:MULTISPECIES: hypothetical protein [unclassified Microcoleus]|uniref:hypothetical protein n=1 Tax=unclassified Microcoleus TaxID=2642155 RepID=UPI0025F67635|nr:MULTISPECIES: hypothetical protein [unclassified Microcoleus]
MALVCKCDRHMGVIAFPSPILGTHGHWANRALGKQGIGQTGHWANRALGYLNLHIHNLTATHLTNSLRCK